MKIFITLATILFCSNALSEDITEHHLSVITPPTTGEYTIFLSAYNVPEYWGNNGTSKIRSTLYQEGRISTNLKINKKLMVSIDDISEAGVFTILANNNEIKIKYNGKGEKTTSIRDATITPDIIISKYTNRGEVLEFYIAKKK